MPIELDIRRFGNPTQIGRGSTGLVYQVEDFYNGGDKAVKVYDPDKEKERLETVSPVIIGSDRLIRGTRDYEAAVIEALQGVPHLINSEGVLNDQDVQNRIWVPREGIHSLVTDFVDGMTLFEVYQKEEDPELVKEYLRQFIETITEAARKGYSLGDIKPDDLRIEPSTRQIRVVDLNYAEPLSDDPEERQYQWNRDLVSVQIKLSLVDYNHNGQPIFDQRPLTNWVSRGDAYATAFEFGEIDQDFIKYEILSAAESAIKGREEKIGRALERIEQGKQIGLNLESPQEFVASLIEHQHYGSFYSSLVQWGKAMRDEGEDPGLVDSQLLNTVQSEFKTPGTNDWSPHNLAELALKLSEEKQE